MIYGSGARKFAFQNLAPLGCLPAVKQANGNVQECVRLPSEMAELHNKKLLQLLVELSRQLSGFQYSFYDFFSSIQNRVIKSKTYSKSFTITIIISITHKRILIFEKLVTFIISDAAFETGMAACCGTGSVNGTSCSTSNVCAKPEDYLFFDGKHLTQEGNLQVGHLIWGSDPEVVGPNNLRELLFLPLDITVTLADIQEAMVATMPRQIKIESLYDIKKMEAEMENQWLYEVDKATSFLI